MKKILCKSCLYWVDCGEKESKPYGFCLIESLFTYTAKTRCNDYECGTPVSEQEFEEYNGGSK